jgi:hypothetical protein
MSSCAIASLLRVALLASLLAFFETAIAGSIGSGPYADNCVLYLRHVRHVKLPQKDLTTWGAKRSIINSEKAKKGRVAIIEIPSGKYKQYGHVALVVDVDDDGKKKSITIEEANYPSPGYWRRKVEGSKMSDLEKKLNIRGYYKP